MRLAAAADISQCHQQEEKKKKKEGSVKRLFLVFTHKQNMRMTHVRPSHVVLRLLEMGFFFFLVEYHPRNVYTNEAEA